MSITPRSPSSTPLTQKHLLALVPIFSAFLHFPRKPSKKGERKNKKGFVSQNFGRRKWNVKVDIHHCNDNYCERFASKATVTSAQGVLGSPAYFRKLGHWDWHWDRIGWESICDIDTQRAKLFFFFFITEDFTARVVGPCLRFCLDENPFVVTSNGFNSSCK